MRLRLNFAPGINLSAKDLARAKRVVWGGWGAWVRGRLCAAEERRDRRIKKRA